MVTSKEDQKAWRGRNPEKVKASRRRRRAKAAEESRQWRQNNPEKVREYKRREYRRNREKHRARSKAYRKKHKRRLRAKALVYYHEHREVALARAARYRRDHPERTKEQRRNSRLNRRGMYVLFGIRRTCKKRGLALDLTAEWIEERLVRGVCELSGLPFDMVGKRTPNSPSVDRRDPRGGYTMDNCRVILWFLNRAISNLGEDYALMVFEKVLARRVTGL